MAKANDLNNTVIKVLTKEHGEKVIEWWKSQGVERTEHYTGEFSENDGYERIYYGIIDGLFDCFTINFVRDKNAKIIELPKEEFDLTTIEGLLAYAKKHYPIGTKYTPMDSLGSLYGTSCISSYEPTLGRYDNNIHCGGGFIYVHGKNSKWAEIIKQEEKVMETQKLSREGLKEIHSAACDSWKKKLEEYASRNLLENYVEITQEEVNDMFKACTSNQLPIVSKYLKKDDGSVDLTQYKLNKDGIYKDGLNILTIRKYGEYENKAFLLCSSFNWEIKTDELGQLCLIPTNKEIRPTYSHAEGH